MEALGNIEHAKKRLDTEQSNLMRIFESLGPNMAQVLKIFSETDEFKEQFTPKLDERLVNVDLS